MIKVGLLWYDGSAGSLKQKVLKAAQRYQKRFGKRPNVCYVHPETLTESEYRVNGIVVRPSARVLTHHLWLGQEDETTLSQPR